MLKLLFFSAFVCVLIVGTMAKTTANNPSLGFGDVCDTETDLDCQKEVSNPTPAKGARKKRSVGPATMVECDSTNVCVCKADTYNPTDDNLSDCVDQLDEDAECTDTNNLLEECKPTFKCKKQDDGTLKCTDELANDATCTKSHQCIDVCKKHGATLKCTLELDDDADCDTSYQCKDGSDCIKSTGDDNTTKCQKRNESNIMQLSSMLLIIAVLTPYFTSG